MDSCLQRFSELVKELNKTNSTNEKISVLKKFEDCKQLLGFTYDTIRYQYGVTSDNINTLENQLKNDLTEVPVYNTISDLLISLSNRTLTGHMAVKAVLVFIYNNCIYRDLILDIIDRNIKKELGQQSSIRFFLDVLVNLVWH